MKIKKGFELPGVYAAFFDQAKDAFALIDPKTGRFLDFNVSAHRNLGYTRAGFQRLKMEDIEDCESGSVFKSYTNKITETRKMGVSFEAKHRAKNGRLIDVLVDMRKIRINGEELISVIWHNISTIKKQTETLMQQARELEKFQLAVDNAFTHIVITDPEGIILYANKAVEKITGFSVSEILGKKVGTKELWGGQMDGKFYKNLWRTVKIKKQVFTSELTNKRKNGHRYTAEAYISPVLDKKRKVVYFIGIERDITIERESERAQTEFLAMASHQLKTPLTNISLITELILSGMFGKIGQDAKEQLKEMYESEKKMARLINTLLSISRIEMKTLIVRPQTRNIKEIILKTVKNFKPQLHKKELKMEVVFDDFSKPSVKFDPDIMENILRNIIDNAIKFTPEKGKITINVKKRKRHILVMVSDTGHGIPKKLHAEVFNKKIRPYELIGNEKFEGTGLGLYIAKSLLELCGGRIWFKSRHGAGTTFYISMPFRNK